jgi:DNA-binding MarR family transcriptional regulator
MSTSKPRGGSGSAPRPVKQDGGGVYQLPPTVTQASLLQDGSDRRFRVLINDLLTIAARMETVREHLGRSIGVSAAQYSMLVAIAHLQDERGVSVGALAQAMHVSSAFVASETGKMARLGLVHKRSNPDDRRGVLLSLAAAGRLKIDRIAAELQALNDLFFGTLDTKAFGALCASATLLVEGSKAAMQYLAAVEHEPQTALDAAG